MTNQSTEHSTNHDRPFTNVPSTQTTSAANTPEDDTTTQNAATTNKRNAFSELMAPKQKQVKLDSHPPATHLDAVTRGKRDSFRSGLLQYIANPASFASTTVLRVTKDTVLIRDLFPKALVHLLLLPRGEAFYNLKPFEAFKDANFLALMRSEASSAADLAASELSRLVSPYSQIAKAREEALETFDPEADGEVSLPAARDFREDIRVGIHAEPSMDTLHVHIISVDMLSERLKHKKHYNSFNTRFFVSLDDFPLTDGDERMREDRQEGWIKGDMKCWRCGKNFTNKFKELEKHLEQEYLEWRRI